MPRISQKQRDANAAESIATLTDPEGYNIQPGDILYTSHHNPETYLRVFIVKPDRQGNHIPFNITWHVARALGVQPTDKGGEWYIRNPVYGMDRGFDVVYRLSYALFKDMPEDTRRDINPNRGSADAGYLLHQRWL